MSLKLLSQNWKVGLLYFVLFIVTSVLCGGIWSVIIYTIVSIIPGADNQPIVRAILDFVILVIGTWSAIYLSTWILNKKAPIKNAYYTVLFSTAIYLLLNVIFLAKSFFVLTNDNLLAGRNFFWAIFELIISVGLFYYLSNRYLKNRAPRK